MGKRIMKSSFVFLIIIALTACSGKTKNDEITVRVACFPNLTHSQALIGMAQGQFQKAVGEKNKIEWKVFNAGPSEIEALFAGEIDIGYIGPVPAINGYVKSRGGLQILAGATDAGAVFVSRKDLVIKDLKELKGKKLAVPQFGNTQHLSLLSILHENGLKEKSNGGDVEVLQAENPEIKTLLDKGDIDAALVPEPWGSRLIKEVKANVILDYDQIMRNGKYTTSVVIARTDFMKEHPEIVEKFLRAHIEITDYINENIDESMKCVNAKIKDLTKSSLSEDILGPAFKRLTVTWDPERESIDDFVKLSSEAGILKEKPDVQKLLNLEPLNKILKEKGQKGIDR